MAELIIIRGKRHFGKTTTIGLVYQKLLDICDKRHEFKKEYVDRDSLQYKENGDTCDFIAILTFNNKKIGIISDGDYAPDVRNRLGYLLENKMDIIICSTRSRNVRGSAYRLIINEFSKENNIALEIFTKHSADKIDQYRVKESIVDKILNKVKELLEK